MRMNRRSFLQGSMLAAGALSLPGMSLGFAGKSAGGGALIAVYLRGGADGLNIVVPHGDSDYYRLRPGIAVPRPGQTSGALDLDGFFGLHPSLAPLQPAYAAGDLALVHACGGLHGSRSHFDAQELMERGVDSKSGATSGWLGRAVEMLPGAGEVPFLAAGVGNAVPRALSGPVPALGIASLDGFDLSCAEADKTAARYAILGGYPSGTATGIAALQTLEAIDLLKDANPAAIVTDPAASYPTGAFGNNLRQLAQLLKADIGLRAAGVDLGGWDHHNNETQALAPLLDELARGLAAFRTDLGPLAQQISVVVMSEFGRRAFENGSSGTDHGAGNLMLVLGGGVRGGRVYAQWPGLKDADLDRGDLKITVDYRQVLSEVIGARLPEADPGYVLADYDGGQALGLF